MYKGNSVVTRKDGIAAINADWNWWKGIANALGGQVSRFTYRHAASIVLHDGQVIEVVGPVAEYIASTTTAQATIDELRGALRFYAEEWEQDVDAERTSHGWVGSLSKIEPSDALRSDKGERARTILARTGETQ